MALIKLRTLVRVVGAADGTANFYDRPADNGYLRDARGRFCKSQTVGRVVRHETEGMTGDTPEDPLHIVQFSNGIEDGYWFEELEEVRR